MAKSRARKQQLHTARKQRKAQKHRAMMQHPAKRQRTRRTIPQPVARPLIDISPWLEKFRASEDEAEQGAAA